MGLRRFVSCHHRYYCFANRRSMHAAKTASCTFDTFSAPSGYTLNTVQGVSDDGTVVGQLIDNKTQEYVAFTRCQRNLHRVRGPAVLQYMVVWTQRLGHQRRFLSGQRKDAGRARIPLQGSTFTAVNYPKAANTWLFDVNQLGARRKLQRGRVRHQRIRASERHNTRPSPIPTRR